MARQRTPDAQRRIRPAAAGEGPQPTTVRDWLLDRRKMLAALLGVPVAFLFLKLGVADVVGADLSKELEVSIVSLVLAAIVERIPNGRRKR